jgi:tRNA(Ile)-lysidine synthetase-like protein
VNAGKGWKLINRYEKALFVPGESGRGRKSEGTAIAKESTGQGKIAGPRKDGTVSHATLATPGEFRISLGKQARLVTLSWDSRGKCTPMRAMRLAAKGDAEVFDAACLKLPLTVRPLRAGDRIRPFGAGAGGNARGGGKKVKEILIDRKVPRDDRWGRPVVCDAEGAILWIPGVLRSAVAPVNTATRKTAILRIRSAK